MGALPGRDGREQIISLLAQQTGRSLSEVVCQSRAGDAALVHLSEQLAAGIETRTLVVVRVLDLPIVNAFALPGGQVLLFDGLLDFAEAPAELAGVLAHEIAHVAHRHPIEIWLESAGTAALIGLLVGDVAGGTVLAGLGQLFVDARYTQEAERQADATGAELMMAAGIATQPVADFFDRLAVREGALARDFSMLLTHPPTPERSAAIRALPADGAEAMSEDQWHALRRICD